MVGRKYRDGASDYSTSKTRERRDAGDIGREWLNKKRDPCLFLASTWENKTNAKEQTD